MLKTVLKVIDQFMYDHLDQYGDAFECWLDPVELLFDRFDGFDHVVWVANVADIGVEQAIVNGSCELGDRFHKKTETTIARVLGD